MKAARYHRFGDPDVLVVEEVERPVPGAGEVLIQVAAAAFNPVDSHIRQGALQAFFPVVLPHTPCIDVSGTVAELGDGVSLDRVAVGDEIVAYLPLDRPGAAAEYIVVPAELLVSAPTTVPLADAAALPSSGLTAVQTLFEHGGLQAGQRVLVTAAGGSVGGLTTQLAVAAGAVVVASASPRHADRLRAQGAREVVGRTDDLAPDAIEPVDLIVNLAPVPTPELAVFLRPGGTIISVTTPAADDPERGTRGARINAHPDSAQLARLVADLDAGRISLDIGDRVPLADIARAHRGETRGKTLLIPSESPSSKAVKS
ncbi:NADP-dependent oxidoreductase [Actinocorallia aurantiaca]|uniref:NADP-dependent oxidoreductase n=1 Tax=Actinocorallia aurantiaca TaxID=46204 RepID=A0ABN3UCP9_9ACTN